MPALPVCSANDLDGNDPLFEKIADDLSGRNYSVIPNALPVGLSTALFAQIQGFSETDFVRAGIGRDDAHTFNAFVRRDSIRWIDGLSVAEQDWLQWTQSLQTCLNRRLFLGLSSFESHFACYQAGDFYRRHLDAFRQERRGDELLQGNSNRVISLAAYFNPGWLPDDGGELLLHEPDDGVSQLKITPAFGTLVVFLSTEVPHEVLPARRDRYSIAGWYRSGQQLC
ncbi:MAG: 2OG-Fe(II) oxygenase [Pseudomonadales bacterium]|nr:2OG-Fe(II) oxygenase [Pseudomonadales bacterium]